MPSSSTPVAQRGPTADRPRVLPVLGRVVPVVLVANLIIFGLATVAGVDFQIQTPGATQPDTVSWVPVIVMSVVPLHLGGLALAVTKRWAPRSWTIWAWVGLAVGVVSLPFFAEASVGTKVALSALHLVTAVTWFVVVRRAVRAARRS